MDHSSTAVNCPEVLRVSSMGTLESCSARHVHQLALARGGKAVRAVAMAYRDIIRPRNSQGWRTDVWTQWAIDSGLAPSVTPVAESTCRMCYGAVGFNIRGEPYSKCQHCSSYASLAGLVPAAYSLDEGLESMLHRFKDFGDEWRWMRAPLASLAHTFLSMHTGCIERRYGRIELATIVPSSPTSRGFDHLASIISTVASWPVVWNQGVLVKMRPGRPPRGVVDPSFYGLADPRQVTDRTVLLFDDTWTSGSTTASAASRLRSAGARSVVAFTIGRQLTVGWGSSDVVLETVRARKEPLRGCVICA